MDKNDLPYLLMVEDDLAGLLLMQKYLQKMFVCHAAVSAEEAIKLAETNNYSTFLIDIKLSTDINGIDLMMSLRKMEQFKNASIIAVTAYFRSIDIQYLKDMGFTDVIIKPFKKEKLIEVLQSNLILS